MTQVEVCNLALGWVGSELITSINDSTTPARLCKANWNSTRDVVLASREWAFAIRRYEIAPDTTAPVFGWDHRFPIPSNVLRVLRCEDGYGEDIDWQREGNFIVSDEATVHALCLVRVETMSDLPEYFGQALAAMLASNLAIPLAQSAEMQKAWYAIYLQKLKDAISIDSMQGRSRQLSGPGLSRVR